MKHPSEPYYECGICGVPAKIIHVCSTINPRSHIYEAACFNCEHWWLPLNEEEKMAKANVISKTPAQMYIRMD